MVFPPVHWFSGITGRGARLSDIEFLTKKEFDGKLRTAEGFLSAAGDLATLTANTGKDMYIARAKCVFFPNTGAMTSTGDTVVLKVNGVIKETGKGAMASAGTNSASGSISIVYEFKNMGYKVLTGEIIKLEVISIGAQVDVEGFIECFEETTGETPVI